MTVVNGNECRARPQWMPRSTTMSALYVCWMTLEGEDLTSSWALCDLLQDNCHWAVSLKCWKTFRAHIVSSLCIPESLTWPVKVTGSVHWSEHLEHLYVSSQKPCWCSQVCTKAAHTSKLSQHAKLCCRASLEPSSEQQRVDAWVRAALWLRVLAPNFKVLWAFSKESNCLF